MKKFLPYILILVLTVGFFAPVFSVSAQEGQPTLGTCDVRLNDGSQVPGLQPMTWDDCQKQVTLNGGSFGGWMANGSNTQTQVDPTEPSAEASCNLNPSTWANCVINGLTDILVSIAYLLLSIVSLLLWLSGTLLDYVLKYTIIDMKAHIAGGMLNDGTNTVGLNGINIAWKLIRDLMNIAFIFLLVYEAIKLIIGQGDLKYIKKFITYIVIASLLINFSLFFTEVMIDGSNIITIGFYNAILNNSDAGVATPATPTGAPGTPTARSLGNITGLSVPFMRALRVTDMFSSKSFEEMRNNSGGNLNMLITPLLGIVLIVIVSFVFFSVSLIFIIRYLVLIILLMLSPIAYMGYALPFMKGYAGQWWESFKGQLLFAPIYMVMTWVALTLMGSAGFFVKDATTGAGSTLGSLTSGAPGSIDLIFNFIIIIGLVIASLVIAKSTAAQGSKLIGQATGKLTAFAGGAVVGGTARFARGTVGRIGNSMANDENLQERAKTSTFARMQLAAANRAAGSTFDARATGTFGAIAGATGMKNDFGKVDSKKENFRAELKAQTEAAEKKAEMYKPSEAKYAAAKEADKITKAQAEADKKNINDRNVAEKDKVHEVRTREYFASDAWKNSADGKAETEALKAREAHAKEKAEMDRTTHPGLKKQMEANVNRLKQEADNQQAAIAKADKARQEYKDKERERIEKIASGKSKPAEDRLNEQYADRVKAVASDVGHDKGNMKQAWWRLGAGTVGTVAYTMGLSSAPKSREDRQTLGRAMIKKTNPKSAQDNLVEAAKALQEQSEGKTDEATPEATPTPAPAPAAPPPPPPPPPAPTA